MRMGWASTITAGITAVAWCAGCGTGAVSGADGSPGGADGAGEEAGVTVEFATLGPNGQPAAEGPLEFELFTVEKLTLQLHDLRLIGDTAPSGDLVFDSRAMQFPSTSGSPRVSFVQAPPGIYSRFTFEIERSWADETLPEGFEGQRLSVRVIGEAHIGNKDRKFTYDCDELTSIALDFDHEVEPGVPGMIAIELDLQEWFTGVDWEMLDSQGNPNMPIMIGMGMNQETADILRAALAGAFEVRE
jgi:hypothetical protein